MAVDGGQAAINTGSALVIGAGVLSGHFLLALAGAGVWKATEALNAGPSAPAPPMMPGG